MNTAQVQNNLAVNQDPDVIVTGEIEVHFFAIEVLIAAASGIIGKTKVNIRTHAEPPFGSCSRVIALSGFVEIIGLACIFAGTGAPFFGRDVACCVGIRRVQRQEVGILATTFGVRRRFQIVVDIESLLALIVGSCIEPGIVIVVTVKVASGVCIELEQVITLAQIMLTHNISCSEQLANQRIIKRISSKCA